MNNQAQTELPLHQHGAFYDVQAALIFISQAKDALLGIPVEIAYNENERLQLAVEERGVA